MDRESKMIHREMEQTRSALAEKLETLERKVSSTVEGATDVVQDATAAVSDTVETVQDAVEETVATVKGTVQEAVSTVKDTFDIRRQVERHPWAMLGGAMVAGFLAERWLGGGGPKRVAAGVTSMAVDSAEKSLGYGKARDDHGNGKHGHRKHANGKQARSKVAVDTPAEAGQGEEGLGQVLRAELGQLKKLAISATLGVVRDMVAESLAEEISKPFGQILDAITDKLGGAPLPRPGQETPREDDQRGAEKQAEGSASAPGFAWERA